MDVLSPLFSNRTMLALSRWPARFRITLEKTSQQIYRFCYNYQFWYGHFLRVFISYLFLTQNLKSQYVLKSFWLGGPQDLDSVYYTARWRVNRNAHNLSVKILRESQSVSEWRKSTRLITKDKRQTSTLCTKNTEKSRDNVQNLSLIRAFSIKFFIFQKYDGKQPRKASIRKVKG